MRGLLLRVLRMILVLLIVSFLTMAMVRFMDQEPAYAILGETATPDQVERFNKEAGLDQPLLTQWVSWLQGWFQGDFGTSLRTKEPVSAVLMERLPVTLEIAFLSSLIALSIAVPMGIYTAYRSGGRLDRLTNAASSVAVAVPGFALALILVYFLAFKAGILPVAGWVPFTESPIENLRHVLLPAITLAAIEAAIATRVLRSDMQATLKEDFILAARAQGMPTRTILWRHALRPSSLSLVTIAGVSLGRLIGGTVLVETIFALPGVGQALVQAIYSSDIVLVQGLTMFLVICVVLINLGVDLLYPVIDPRVSIRRG